MTFKSASKRLVKLFQLPELMKFFAERRISWMYNLPKAPWWGGFFERLVKSTKSCLKKVVGFAKLNRNELNTVLVEIEAVLNSRPLTHLYPEDISEPLTPSHLLMGRRLISLPYSVARDSEDQQEWGTKENLTKRIKYLLLTLEHFKLRWKKEYLSELREHHRNLKRDEHRSSIHQGDIVTVHNENKSNRLFWNLGRIKSLIFGRDNEIRGANVQLSNGNVIARPLQKLFPLEVTCSSP